LISRIVKVKTIMSVHSKVYKHKRFSYKSKILIAVSESIKNHLVREFFIDESRIKVLNNFIDPKELLSHNDPNFNRDNIGLSDENFVVTFIGRFSKEKGIDILLNAFYKVQLKYKKLILLMIGEGEEKDHIKNYIHSNNLNARILSPAENVFKYYKISDVIVLPSRTDPFPMVMLEAGLTKKPFIGSKVDGIDEFIEDGKNGLLIKPENVDELLDAILKILKDKDFATYVANNLNIKVLNECQLNQALPKLERIYSDIYNGN
jgi:glycosyltransferase involved in cell wall biosynthesis